MAFNIYQRIEISTANDISCILHCFTASDANILNLHPWHSSAASGADLGAPLRPAVLLFVFSRGQKIIPNQGENEPQTNSQLVGACVGCIKEDFLQPNLHVAALVFSRFAHMFQLGFQFLHSSKLKFAGVTVLNISQIFGEFFRCRA